VIAIDNNNILSQPDSCCVEITLDPPAVTLMADTTVSIHDSITVNATVSDNGTVKKYLWAKNGIKYSDTTTTNSLRLAYPDSGRHVVRLMAVDDDGLYSLVDSCIIMVIAGRPVITAIQDTVVSFSTTTSVAVHVKATDTNRGGSIQKYYWGTGVNMWDDSTDSPSYTVNSTVGGAVVVRWAARDDDGFFSYDTFTVLFNRPPSSVTMASLFSNSSWVTYDNSIGKGTLPLTFSAIDPDGSSDSLRYILYAGIASNLLAQVYSGNAPSCKISGVDSSSTVYYRILVKDLYGDSTVHDSSFITPPSPPRPPSGMALILAKKSNFNMGSTDGLSQEQPVHIVTFLHDYWMDTTEVTQEDFAAFMSFSPSYFKVTNGPVENVSWFDAVLYCNRRSKHDGLDSAYSYTTASMSGDHCTGLAGLNVNYNCNGYRLPTEAEWEYACRAGTSTEHYWGNATNSSYAWCYPTVDLMTHPVGQKKPNSFGLYDMSGNVEEWCNDWFDVDYYKNSPLQDPQGPLTGEEKVSRGGAYSSISRLLCSYSRTMFSPDKRNKDLGFRCVRLR
jgi:formylglycine-generating enzyme required for sulfatase activity